MNEADKLARRVADTLRAREGTGAAWNVEIEAARDTYTRRMEGVSLWIVPSAEIVASDPGDAAELFEPAADKVYRHPTFYSIPDNVKNI